jgi:hypothetical protein
MIGSPRAIAVDEVMTPRSMLHVVSPDRLAEAAYIADEHGFDAVPIVSDGELSSYWSRRSRRERRIAKSQRVSYKQSLAAVLARLVRHGVHFVQYDSQVVGLVDLSDLNKPNARTLFMEPLLQLEQSVVMAARGRQVDDATVARLLGRSAARARARQKRASKQDLDAPLLEFAHFGDLLKVARRLGLMSAGVDEIDRLNEVRNSVFHGARRPVERFEDGRELLWAVDACSNMQETVLL